MPAAGEPMPGPLTLDLVAAVIEGGAPPHSALRAVGAALQAVGDPRGDDLLLAANRVGHPNRSGDSTNRSGDPTNRSGDSSADGEPNGAGTSAPGGAGPPLLAAVEEALALAARAGLPPTALVRRAAAEERRRQLSVQLRAIRRLEVLLVIPAGLCLLPAFVLLGIVPLVIDLILG